MERGSTGKMREGRGGCRILALVISCLGQGLRVQQQEVGSLLVWGCAEEHGPWHTPLEAPIWGRRWG